MSAVTSVATQRMSGMTESHGKSGEGGVDLAATRIRLLGSMAAPGSAAAKLAPQARAVLGLLNPRVELVTHLDLFDRALESWLGECSCLLRRCPRRRR